MDFLAQKRQNTAFWPNIGIFGPLFGSMPDQKNNMNKLPRWFSAMWVPKHLLPPVKIREVVKKKRIFYGQADHKQQNNQRSHPD